MPRLVGKQSNSGASVVLLLLIAIGVASALEYEGVIDTVPNFGKSFIGDRSLGGKGSTNPPSLSGSATPSAATAPSDPSVNQPANQPANSQPSPSPSLAP